ncbi:MAG: BPSS1780 family membrane protein [Gammaproteobacteria bacterium]
MTDQNPYQAPDANLTEGRKNPDVELAVTGIKSLPAMSGLDWIKDAFNLFKMNPLIWIVLVVLWFVLNIVMQFVPIIGGLAMSLLYAVFMAGFMIGCAALERGDDLEVGHLFAGFKSNTGSLIGLGAIYLGIFILLAIVIVGLVFGGMGGLGALADPNSMDPSVLFASGTMIAVLVGLLLFIPIIMMFWFAPVLISLGGVSLIDSLKMSFAGCLKNIVPFLIFSIAMIILAVIASIPFFLGWLVLMPIGMAAFYTAYRAIYTD